MSLYDLLLNDVAIAELIGAFLDTGTEKYQDEELEIDNEEWDKKYEVDPDEIFDVFYGIWDTASDPKNFNELKTLADKYKVDIPQIPIAWSIAKGTLPIIGVTKTEHIEDAVKAMNVKLTKEEIENLEKCADKLGLNLIRFWEKKME